jgi:hypothetical protein
MPPRKETRSRTTEKKRKPYLRPQVVAVSLRAEEVLALGCKFATSGADFGDPVTCVGNGCAAPGS